MAERRMFAKTIVLSDAFLDMPLGARCLYMTMGMLADDDGFVNSPKSIIRQCGATDDDLKILFAKRFVIPFESGVVVIKHWRINNYLQKDRYNETKYVDEKSTLVIDENGAYKQPENSSCIHSSCVYTGKDRLGKDRLNNSVVPTTTKRKVFQKPTVKEITDYLCEVDADIPKEVAAEIFDYYESKGWMVGKSPMKDWKSAVRRWARHEKSWNKKTTAKVPDFTMADGKKELSEEDRKLLEEVFDSE